MDLVDAVLANTFREKSFQAVKMHVNIPISLVVTVPKSVDASLLAQQAQNWSRGQMQFRFPNIFHTFERQVS